jgi:hypothetical protein
MPLQAFGLKKYRRSTGPVSRISESEDAPAPLRNSEELRIQNCPLDKGICPEEKTGVSPSTFRYVNVYPCHLSNHRSKASPLVVTEDSGDVFPEGESCS